MYNKMEGVAHFIISLSALIDNRVFIPIGEIYKEIDSGNNVVKWLEAKFPVGSENSFDCSTFDNEFKEYLHEEIINKLNLLMQSSTNRNCRVQTAPNWWLNDSGAFLLPKFATSKPSAYYTGSKLLTVANVVWNCADLYTEKRLLLLK